MGWFGHFNRMGDEILPKQMMRMIHNGDGRRPRGKPRVKWPVTAEAGQGRCDVGKVILERW